MDNQKFGRFIRDLRKKANMTQKELGEKLNVTDKAVSKWERGLGFPDITILNSLAEIFGITASELLNAELGNKENVNLEKAVQDAIEKVTKEKEKKENRKRKIKKILKIISIIIFALMVILQLGYLFVMKTHGYEYISDSLFYIVNEFIIIFGVLFLILQIKNKKIIKIVSIIIACILSIVNIAFMINNASQIKSIISFSNDFSNELVLKIDKETGETQFLRNSKLIIFAKPTEYFEYSVDGNIKHQWLTNDICNLTYIDKDGNLRDYVATYGARGKTISYYYVYNSLLGRWQTEINTSGNTNLIVDSKGIKVTRNKQSEQFTFENCKQFGTTALVLYKEEVPKYVIALNEDCKIDSETDIIKSGGTITFCDVSMNKTTKEKLNCRSDKSGNLANYTGVDIEANEYEIDNGILYISYDGESTIEVPGDFANEKSEYNDYNYQISEDKTVFFYRLENRTYLVYSDDLGKNWTTVVLNNDIDYIQNIHFLNKDLGFMLQFNDSALAGVRFGSILKTIDGGKTWTVVNNGIGDSEMKIYRDGSQILFTDENTGFITMPNAGGEKSELYYSTDGGFNFTKVSIGDDKIYDYYNLPTLEQGKLYLDIGQGSDGDYNGGDSKRYCSEDNGKTWNEV